jgi:hypothetical protein
MRVPLPGAIVDRFKRRLAAMILNPERSQSLHISIVSQTDKVGDCAADAAAAA